MPTSRQIFEKISTLKIHIPPFVEPNGKYELVSVCDSIAYTSGQLPRLNNDGKLICGPLAADQDIREAIEAAKISFVRALLALDHKIGDLSHIKRLIFIRGFVNAEAGFSRHARILDGVSQLAIDLFGPHVGKHSRSALGAGSLPSVGLVEVEVIAKVENLKNRSEA